MRTELPETKVGNELVIVQPDPTITAGKPDPMDTSRARRLQGGLLRFPRRGQAALLLIAFMQ